MILENEYDGGQKGNIIITSINLKGHSIHFPIDHPRRSVKAGMKFNTFTSSDLPKYRYSWEHNEYPYFREIGQIDQLTELI